MMFLIALVIVTAVAAYWMLRYVAYLRRTTTTMLRKWARRDGLPHTWGALHLRRHYRPYLSRVQWAKKIR